MSASEFLRGRITETYLQDAVVPLLAGTKKDQNCPTWGGTSAMCNKPKPTEKRKPSKKKPLKKKTGKGR